MKYIILSIILISTFIVISKILPKYEVLRNSLHPVYHFKFSWFLFDFMLNVIVWTGVFLP